MKKPKSIIEPVTEEDVRHLFSLHAKQFKFEILKIQRAFPDCTAIDQRVYPEKEVDIELEYDALNFLKHGHINHMQPGRDYIIVCWKMTSRKGIPPNIEIFTLEDKINIVSYINRAKLGAFQNKPIYKIISYNPDKNKKSLDIWEEIKIFRTNARFRNNDIPEGSVIVLHSKGKLVGEFMVAKYHYIDNPPSTQIEKQLYNISSFPIGFSKHPMPSKNEDWLKGHIVYYDFKRYDPPVSLNILGKKLSSYGERNLTFQDLQRIRGKIK